jgi:hypothetical protein
MLEPLNFKPVDFTNVELDQILEKSTELIERGYFTGVNLIQSNTPLPKEAIIIHFLHNLKEQIEGVQSAIKADSFIVPRLTYYATKPDYLTKDSSEVEYKDAVILDQSMQVVPFQEARINPEGKRILHMELDLIIPLTEEGILEETITKLKEADRSGPDPWIDPAIIVKSKRKLRPIRAFFDKHYVSLMRNREEFYSIISDPIRADALTRYLNKLCERNKIGTIQRSDIVFYSSQINEEFMRYLLELQKPLDTHEE